MDETQQVQVGALLKDARQDRGMTQGQLAALAETSEDVVAAVELGHSDADFDLLGRLGRQLGLEVVPFGRRSQQTHMRVHGGKPLTGTIDVKSSKNAGVALLCASLLTSGRTILRKVARIEEVNRILEVLTSIGVQVRWLNNDNDLEIVPPRQLDLGAMDVEAARRTRSVIMLLGPLMHIADNFELPYAGGCRLGTRTVQPHMTALRPFGLHVVATEGQYVARVDGESAPDRPIVLTERGDTVTENALLAAAKSNGTAIIRNASSNYMVQDLCFFLIALGVEIDGIGTTTLTVRGRPDISCDVDYAPSEDPIEAMSLLTAAIITNSQITIRRVPIEFLEIELAILDEMGFQPDRGEEYTARNGRTRLVDLTTLPSTLTARVDKIHPMPFPGLNIDNLPFFALVAAAAQGSTLIHDWVYENRAIYLTELSKLGASVRLLDPHRIYVEGPTTWSAAELMCPPALRPAVVILLAMLAAKGTSLLRNVYVIERGYEDLALRLNELGARIELLHDF